MLTGTYSTLQLFQIRNKTKHMMNVASKKVRALLASGRDITGEYMTEFYMTIPSVEDHRGHPVSGLVRNMIEFTTCQ
jgi:hypothetical protein